MYCGAHVHVCMNTLTDTQININILICLWDWRCLLHEGGTSYLHKQGQTSATSKGESQWRYRLLGQECTDTLSLWAWNYINIRKTNRNQSRPPVLKEKKKGSEHCHVGSCSLLPLSLVSEHHLCCKDTQWWHWFCQLSSLAAEGRPCLAFNPTWLAKTVQHRQRRRGLHHTFWGPRVPDDPRSPSPNTFEMNMCLWILGMDRLMVLSLHPQTHICWLEQRAILTTQLPQAFISTCYKP